MTSTREPRVSFEQYSTTQLTTVIRNELEAGEYRPTAMMTCIRAGGTLPGVQVAVVIPNHGTQWGLPQGGVEVDDANVMAAARRELHEEIGLNRYDVMYARPTGSAIRTTRPTTEKQRDGFSRGSVYFPVAAIATTDAHPQSLDGIWSAGWQSLPCFAEDIAEQHGAHPNSRTVRTIAALDSTLPVIGEVLLERDPPMHLQDDLRLTARILRPAVRDLASHLV
jgi:8-oxo-dGTP pyrophosphatase MutT (NUDIX family)